MDPTTTEAYQLALAGTVDADAPARAAGVIDIEASRQVVWQTLALVENWPNIRADVTSARADRPPEPGASFTWNAGGVPITSAFAIVERARRLTWANLAPGLAMTCVYEFEELATDRTRIRCEESMDATAVAPHINHQVLAENIRTWLVGVKALAEAGPIRR